jgi:hypothetical protein
MGAHAVAAAADVDHHRVMNEAVDDGAGHHLVGEDLAPVNRDAYMLTGLPKGPRSSRGLFGEFGTTGDGRLREGS